MINANTYEEVYEILSYMDKMTVMKVPVELLEVIKNNRNENYKTLIDKNDIFNMNNISDETRHVLAWLDVNYWMDEKKKKHLKEIYYKKQKILYNPEDIFENKINEKEKQIDNNTKIVKYKEPIFVKIINKIKNIFIGN